MPPPPRATDAILIAGANGAGKTTFALDLLPTLYPDAEFLNTEYGAPSADVRIVVNRKGGGFEAEAANLEVPKWTAPRPPSE